MSLVPVGFRLLKRLAHSAGPFPLLPSLRITLLSPTPFGLRSGFALLWLDCYQLQSAVDARPSPALEAWPGIEPGAPAYQAEGQRQHGPTSPPLPC